MDTVESTVFCERGIYGFRESKYEELLIEIYKRYPVELANGEIKQLTVPAFLLAEDSDEPTGPNEEFILPICKEYITEPEPKVGMIYLLQRHKIEGRVFSAWKNCGSKKANNNGPQSLKIRYFQHKSPDFASVRKRVITLTADAEESWKLVHIIHKAPKESAKRRRLNQEDAPYVPNSPLRINNTSSNGLLSLASYLQNNQDELMEIPNERQSHLAISNVAPNRGPAEGIVIKVSGKNFSSKAQVIWAGNQLQESKVVFRNEGELWIETPPGTPGATVEFVVQELEADQVFKSNQVSFTYELCDAATQNKMRLIDEKFSQIGSIVRNAGDVGDEGINQIERVIEEAYQLLSDIRSNPQPHGSCEIDQRIESLRLSIAKTLELSQPSRKANISNLINPTTTQEADALLALQSLSGDSSPARSGDSEDFECLACQLHFAKEELYKEHLLTPVHLKKVNGTEFVCQTCGVSCNSAATLDLHLSSKRHNKREYSNFACNTCSSTSRSLGDWQAHLNSRQHMTAVSVGGVPTVN